ncbi:phage tail length tape measure family protein [Rhizobium leguminosarum]|uniref:phage tail length tape measure family protein n=1 Tax=Rhizobium leguminosarum TaxID=384 RepID=UPI0003751B53|nr:phage tail length tape measure family protein [Rhizobium leguminosarum]
MSVAQLGFAIDSSQAAGAAADLDKLTSSAAKAEQAAQRTGAAGTRMSRGFADLNPALDKIVGSLGRLEGITTSIDKRLDAMTSAAGRAARANQVLDKSAIEASTAYKQLEASLNAVTAAQKKGDASLATSLSAIEKQREAIARLNAELQKLRAAPAPAPGGRPSPANNNGSQGNVGNIAAQFFDIGTTSAFMNPATVAIQQGPQLAQAFAGQSTKQALAGLAGGLAAIVSPLSLVAIGLTGAAAAAISYGVSALTASDDTKKLEDAMERHDGIMKRLEERYGSLIDKVKGYGIESTRMLSIEASSDIRGLRNATKITGEEFFSGIGTQTRGGYVADNSMFGSGFMAFNDAITKLRNEFKAGRPDFEAFYDSIYKTAQTDPAFAKKADELAKLVAQFREGSRALEEMERIQRRLFNDVGPNGMLLSQGPTSRDDMGNLALWQSQQKVAAQRRQQSFDAQVQGVNARSPQERAAAARASAAAQYNGDESVTERRVRIEQAGALALVQAERQLADAQRDRALNLDKTLQDQQQEIDLVGKTGGAAAALRKEYELTSALRMEAARQGIDVDQKELDLIHQRAQALGELTDKYNQSRFNFEMGQQTADARLSPRDRQITTTLRQYGLPEDLGGSNAAMIGKQYDWQQAKDMAKGFGSAFSNELVSGSHDIGKSFLKGFESAVTSQASKLWEKFFDGIGNMFADMLTGTKGSGAGSSSVGLVGGVASAVMGRGASNNNQVTSSGSAVDLASGLLGKNETSGRVDINSFLKKGGVDIDAARTAWCAGFVNSSLEQVGVDGSGSLVANSFQKWGKAVDPSSVLRGDVLLQSRGLGANQKGGHVGLATGSSRIFDGQRQLEMLSGNQGDAVSNAWVNASELQVRRATEAADALGGLASSSGAATQGLGKLGQSLSTSFFPAAPSAPAQSGGGGLFGWLSGLFGGFKPIGAQATLAASGGISGLFADGTNYAPGGMAIVGERGPELVNLPQGSQVFNTNRSAQMMGGAGNDNAAASAPRKLEVHVHGGSGDEHVRELARQGAQEALYQDKIDQTRGGFGNTQKKFNTRKG